LDEDSSWDPVVKEPGEEEVAKKVNQAWNKAFEWEDKIPIGVFYQNSHIPTFEERIKKDIPCYTDLPPAEQVIAKNDGRPVIDAKTFKILFKEKIVKIRTA